jgi:hypothetical protein
MGAFYSTSIINFIDEANTSIVGSLTIKSGLSGFHQQMHSQTLSWDEEINILKSAFKQLLNQHPHIAQFGVLLEYPIARRDKRIDAVILANATIIIVEFKVGKTEYSNVDRDQLLDYCLDLRDFHYESRGKNIVPVLLATNAGKVPAATLDTTDFVKPVFFADKNTFPQIFTEILNQYDGSSQELSLEKWNNSDYSPTPTIIEAAQTLYAGKSVVEISRSHAGRKNLTKTSNAVVDAIKIAKANNEKIVCFITGVPGAGKTLAGLNIAHDKEFQDSEKSIATFLSGNGPLIKVLRGALGRDAHKKLQKKDKAAKQKESDRVIAFIENVHRFLDHYFFDKDRTPNNKIVIFDEAQRAWNAEHSMRKFQRPFSEPEMMFEIMNRHEDWAVIVALVGGGQEINTGEAGLPEWGRIIQEKFNNWKIYISPQLKVGNHSTGDLTLFEQEPKDLNIVENSDLHLDVSIRSYKAEKLSHWVSLVLSNSPAAAKLLFETDLINYKIVLTRDLDNAKNWLKERCKGTRRMGLVASSGGRRLKPFGLDVRTPLEAEHWFLNDKADVRSSYYLEIPATEFGVQGLELDWVGVCWDLDLKRNRTAWDFNAFVGTKWQKVEKGENQNYLINKYRVLLTRAREGMVIFVPNGAIDDPTRPPAHYDQIATYLKTCGLLEI